MAKAPQIAVQISAQDKYSAVMAKCRADMERTFGSVSKMRDRIESAGMFNNMTTGLGELQRRSRSVFSDLTRSVPGLGALAGAGTLAGIGALTTRYADMGVSLQNTARAAGTTASRMDSLRGAARLMGMSTDVADQAMVGLNRTLAAALYGKDDVAAQAFNRMGLSLRAVGGGAITAEQALRPISNFVQTLSQSDPRAAVAFLESLHLSPETLTLLGVGGDKLESLRQRAARLSGLSDTDQASMERYADALGSIGIAADRVGRSITVALEPALTPMLRDLSVWTSAHGREIGEGFRQVATGIGEIATRTPEAFRRLREFGGELTTVFNTIREAGHLIGADRLFDWLRDRQAQTRANQVPMGQAPPGASQYDADVYNRLDPLRQHLYRDNADARERFNRQFAPQRYAGGTPAGAPALPGPGDRSPIPPGGRPGGAAGPATPGNDQAPAMSRTAAEFQQTFGPSAQRIGARLGIDPRIILAQWDLESARRGGGGDNNPGNMHAQPGQAGRWVTDNTNGERHFMANYRSLQEMEDATVERLGRKWPGIRNSGSNVSQYVQGLRVGQNGGCAQSQGPDPSGLYEAGVRARMRPYMGFQPPAAIPAPPIPQAAPQLQQPAQAAPLQLQQPAPQQNNGSSTVRIDLTHSNVPAGVGMKYATEGDGVEMGNVHIARAMPE